MDSISSLLKNVTTKSKTNGEPTLIGMAGKSTSETVHSSIIGFLLNPNAHEAGTECLKEFINLFPECSLGKFNPEKVVEVTTEKDFGPVRINEYPTGGRADIYLEDSEGNVVVIENKIYAGDSECQLLRYHNSLTDAGKSPSIIYLSLKGNQPSDESLGVTNADVENPLGLDYVKVLSYTDILLWLSKILDNCSPDMKSNIEQYTRLISNLLMENKIHEEILSSGESYKAAIKVAKNLEDARMTLKREFISNLRKELTELLCHDERYSFEEYSNARNSKLVGFTICSESSGLRYDVVIDWRLYIACNRNYPEILQKDNGTWDYVGGRNALNFHECSELVSDYLSSEDGKQRIPSCAAHLIVEILYEIEGRD
ncbi:MAG: PD-(D/E)XK nuclease family protein [Bacteroidales bacterium]|nr:PD-(D/E)XK nuclease family protein [Bacteroidales bacterium]